MWPLFIHCLNYTKHEVTREFLLPQKSILFRSKDKVMLQDVWARLIVPLFYIHIFFLGVNPPKFPGGSLETIMSPGQKEKDAILIKVGRFTIRVGFKTSPVCADRGRNASDKND